MLSNIIDKSKFVVSNAKFVKIDYSKLDEFTNELRELENKQYLDRSPFGILELSTEEVVNFLLIEGALQFSFWGEPKWSIPTEFSELDGGAALMYAMLNVFKKHKADFFNYVEHLTKDEFSHILEGNVEIPLFDKRYEIIKDIAKTVNEKMKGNFYKYIAKITDDNELFQIIVSNFKNFDDTRIYNDQVIPFYKLAQYITSNILYIIKIKNNVEIDRSHLVGCADYKIPQVLRKIGILKYNEILSKIVDSKIELAENDIKEIEIRASTLVVIDEIWQRINGTIDRIDINNLIWLKGQTKEGDVKPYHLTRTTSY